MDACRELELRLTCKTRLFADGRFNIMDPFFYKFAHLIGLMMLFTGAGALLLPGSDSGARRKPALMLHGIGLLLLLLGGFGMLAKLGKGAPAVYSFGAVWVWLKILVWLFFGASIVLIKRGVLRGPAGWWICIAAGAIAAWAALYKPFL